VNGCQSRVLAILRMFGEIAARSGRRARLTAANSDRADRLKPNTSIVFSKRDSYQRREHLMTTVCKVAAVFRLTLPRRVRTILVNGRVSPSHPSRQVGRREDRHAEDALVGEFARWQGHEARARCSRVVHSRLQVFGPRHTER